jgi:hypothetical protein
MVCLGGPAAVATFSTGLFADFDCRHLASPEYVVERLVHSFLLPEVRKQTLRDETKAAQSEFLIAARSALDASLASMLSPEQSGASQNSTQPESRQ